MRFDLLYDYALKHRADFNELCRVASQSTEEAQVALDIAKWFVNGDRPDEWKLKEWAERLDRHAIDKAFADRATGT